MKKLILLIVIQLSLFSQFTWSQNIFVALNGDDGNPGTLESPKRTVQAGVDLLDAGDTLFIREGTYHEETIIDRLVGTPGAPIVIMPYNHEIVTFDGTIQVDSAWTHHEGSIYKTIPGYDTWQLFDGQEMLMPARWPNAFLHDHSVWDRGKNWARGNESASENGTMVDSPHGNISLASSGIDATGAMAILNVGSWKTFSREVQTHETGSNTFSYNTTPSYKTKHHYYYLEGTLELLDAPGEWVYDKTSGELYAWMPDNQPPDTTLRAKVQSYCIYAEKSEHIKITGIQFFATTFHFHNCYNMTVEDCTLKFPSCSKRMLKETTEPDVTRMYNSNVYSPTNNSLINSVISYTESHAMYLRGNTNLVENCGFYFIDWVVADRPKLMNSMYNEGQKNVFRNNTVQQCGASSTLSPGDFPIVEYNNLSNTGYLQSDGSLVQVVISGQPGSQIRYNWFHNTVKMGARFDAPIPPITWGHGGTMHHNVIWETNIGLMLKGEYHYCYNNSAMKCAQNGIVVYNDLGDGGGGNIGTITRNNFSDRLSGDRSGYMKVPGVSDHNWNGYQTETDFKEEIYDFENLDFRPRPGSALVDAGSEIDGTNDKYIGAKPDRGAYEFGDSVYWMAGRKTIQCSNPIPGNNGTTQFEFVDLIWMEGYRSESSDVYFGVSESAVESAGRSSEEYQGNQVNNIFYPGELTAGQAYYWRIDAVNTNDTIKGKVWSFTAGTDANPQVHSALFRIYGSKDEQIFLLNDAQIHFGERKSRSDSTGSSFFKMVKPGTYSFMISKKGYISHSDSIHILSDTVIVDTLEFATYDVTFHVKDLDTDHPVSGCNIDFNGQQLVTDSSGMIFLPGVAHATYLMSASAPGYVEGDDLEFEIYSDTTIVYTLHREYHRISLMVVNKFTGDPVNRALIHYGDDMTNTSSSGDASVDGLLKGYWQFSVEHRDYFLHTDSVLISGDTSMVISLSRTSANIHFVIGDANGPIASAPVEITGWRALSDTDGNIFIFGWAARQEYIYSVEFDGYQSIADTLYLIKDTIIDILLQPLTFVGEVPAGSPVIFPNPAKDKLCIIINTGKAGLRITNAQGKAIHEEEIIEGLNTFDIHGLPEGIYIIHLSGNEFVTIREILIVQ